MLSIEAFIITNLLMNIVVMSVSARCMGHIRWRRVLLAATFGTLYAVAVYSWHDEMWLRSVWAQSVCLLLMAVFLFGHRIHTAGGHALIFLIGSMIFAGGIMAMLDRWLSGGWLMVVGWGCIAASVFAADQLKAGQQIARCRVRVRIATRMGSVDLNALVDTGNRLTEPVSGLPVLIVGAESLGKLIDRSCLYPSGRRLAPGFRMVRYGVLGGEGEMYCFRPKSVCIGAAGRWREAPDVWIGIYRGQLPDDMEALAPPIFGQIREEHRGMHGTREHML